MSRAMALPGSIFATKSIETLRSEAERPAITRSAPCSGPGTS